MQPLHVIVHVILVLLLCLCLVQLIPWHVPLPRHLSLAWQFFSLLNVIVAITISRL